MTISKRHLVCTCYGKWIYAKKCEWKLGYVRILLVGECIVAVHSDKWHMLNNFEL